MAITVNWATKVITFPQADLTALGGGAYELDVDAFRLALKALEDDETGIIFDDTHRHVSEITLSGTTYSRFFEIINGYTVTIDPSFAGRVSCVGANHNIGDVYNNTTGPTLIINNAAGLQTVETGVSGLTPEESEQLEAVAKFSTNKVELSGDRTTVTVYDDDGVTPFLVFDLSQDLSTRTPQ
jgi:hypothetical protein